MPLASPLRSSDTVTIGSRRTYLVQVLMILRSVQRQRESRSFPGRTGSMNRERERRKGTQTRLDSGPITQDSCK